MKQPTDGQPADDQTTVAQLRDTVRQFVAERDWNKFHSPKNISMSLAIEAAELMEHFQWLTPEESRSFDAEATAAAAEELADVICYALAIANEMDIDVSSSLEQKMVKNRLKYPIEKFHGRF